jgi:hypothetical protein
MAKSKTFVDVELDWAEKQLEQWKEYVDKHPLASLVDRMDYKETKNGGLVKTVIANIETQGKFIQETMKNYLTLLKEVDAMREKEQAKQEAKGQATIPARMQR